MKALYKQLVLDGSWWTVKTSDEEVPTSLHLHLYRWFLNPQISLQLQKLQLSEDILHTEPLAVRLRRLKTWRPWDEKWRIVDVASKSKRPETECRVTLTDMRASELVDGDYFHYNGKMYTIDHIATEYFSEIPMRICVAMAKDGSAKGFAWNLDQSVPATKM